MTDCNTRVAKYRNIKSKSRIYLSLTISRILIGINNDYFLPSTGYALRYFFPQMITESCSLWQRLPFAVIALFFKITTYSNSAIVAKTPYRAFPNIIVYWFSFTRFIRIHYDDLTSKGLLFRAICNGLR